MLDVQCKRYLDKAKFINADKRRRAARKKIALEANKRARAEKGRPKRAAKMATLVRLLDAAVQAEPWNVLLHDRKKGEACGRTAGSRIPEGRRRHPARWCGGWPFV